MFWAGMQTYCITSLTWEGAIINHHATSAKCKAHYSDLISSFVSNHLYKNLLFLQVRQAVWIFNESLPSQNAIVYLCLWMAIAYKLLAVFLVIIAWIVVANMKRIDENVPRRMSRRRDQPYTSRAVPHKIGAGFWNEMPFFGHAAGALELVKPMPMRWRFEQLPRVNSVVESDSFQKRLRYLCALF
jgi:hypothetical protein